MVNKFIMELVWHNCEAYPPKEGWNHHLYATDGQYVFRVEYDKTKGWYDTRIFEYIPKERLSQYWWADLQQTVQNCGFGFCAHEWVATMYSYYDRNLVFTDFRCKHCGETMREYCK